MRIDDDRYLEASPASIGEIKFEIFRTTIHEKSKKNAEKAKRQSTSSFRAPPNSQKVHERSKKAIAHQVTYVASLTSYNTWHSNLINSYGTEISREEAQYWQEKVSVNFVERLVTFIFKYRPLGILKNLPFSNLLA